VEPDTLGWAITALAAGLGIRAGARVFATAPPTVFCWLVEAAEPLEACSRHFVHALDVKQGQMDALFAVLSAVKDGEVSERQAITRLARSPQWGWVALVTHYGRWLQPERQYEALKEAAEGAKAVSAALSNWEGRWQGHCGWQD
jgi:hypothetical protein